MNGTNCCCKGCCRKAVRKWSVLDGADSCGHAVKGQSVNVKTFQTCMRREGRKERGIARKRERNGQRDEERERDGGEREAERLTSG